MDRIDSLVVGYLMKLSEFSERCLLDQNTSFLSMYEQMKGGEIVETESGMSIQKHGAGLRVTDFDGTEVDFDFDLSNSRQPTFNAWRIANFARSLGQERPGLGEVEQAMSEFANFHLLRCISPGWFAVHYPTSAPEQI